MISTQPDGASNLKTTVLETGGLGALWAAYWQSHSFNEFAQSILLVCSIIGSILYIIVMWKKATGSSKGE